MNSSIVKYLLIAGVIVVWGMIVVRIISSLSDKAQVNKAEVSFAPVASLHSLEDAFVLYADYPDPFLVQDDTAYIENSQQPVISVLDGNGSSEVSAPKEEVAPADPDIIRFAGAIINPSTRSKMAIIRLNGKEILIREGGKSDGVRVLKIYNDHVIIKFKSRKIELLIE